MPKIVDSVERRRNIATAAAELFLLEGYNDCSLASVARACGLGRTSLYKYFRDKEAILVHLVDDFFSPLELVAGEANLVDTSPAPQRLIAFMDRVFRAIIAGGARSSFIVKFLLAEEASADPLAAAARRRVRALEARVAALLAEGVEEGSLAPLAPEALAWAFSSLLHGAVIRGLLFGDVDAAGLDLSIRQLVEGLSRRTPAAF